MGLRHTEEGTLFYVMKTACAEALRWQVEWCDVIMDRFSVVVCMCQVLFNPMRQIPIWQIQKLRNRGVSDLA